MAKLWKVCAKQLSYRHDIWNENIDKIKILTPIEAYKVFYYINLLYFHYFNLLIYIIALVIFIITQY